MSKIIHLSDLHIGHKELGKRAWAIANRIIINKPQADDYVILITGDLVEDGKAIDTIEEARRYVDFLKAANFHVLFVPGNHDVGDGSYASKATSRRFIETLYGKNVTFPRVDMINDTAFIGLNSMEEETGWKDGGLSAEGELGKKQIDRLKNILERKTVQAKKYRVLYLHHHPLEYKYFLYLKDADEFKFAIKNKKIDALLFGHYHDAGNWNGSLPSIPRIYDGGSSTGKGNSCHPHRVMNLVKEAASDYDGKFLLDSVKRETKG